jgi:CHAT domain
MTLPRIRVDVTSDLGGGWSVTITNVTQAQRLAEFRMDAVEVDLGDRRQLVPVVSEERRPAVIPDAEHAALCAGDSAAITEILKRVASGSTENGHVRVYGRWLFECLLAPVWASLRASLTDGIELALQWPASEIDLHSLVWEAMHDGEFPVAGRPGFLVAITRVIDTPEGIAAPDILTGSPRVLFVTGSSFADPVIRPGLMFMGLLRKFDAAGISVTRAKYDVTVAELEIECRQFQPDVIHVVAHGKQLPDGSTVLRLGTAGGDVTAAQLRQAITAGSSRPLAVILSACHSGGGPGLLGSAADEAAAPIAGRAAPLAAELVAGGIPIVAAMAGAVSEPACRMYTTRLIDAIHQGRPLSQGAAEGRAAALLSAAAPSDQLDWAMPTTFVAGNVPEDYCPLDPAALSRVVEIARGLRLRWDPIFIGRQDILMLADGILSADLGLRAEFVAILCDGKTDKLGSTRLLREIGFRLLRAGHIPLVLAGYSSGFDQVPPGPANLRTLLADILQQVVKVADEFGVRPPPLTTLGAEPSLAGHLAVVAREGDSRDPGEANHDALLALRDFRRGTTPLDDPSTVQYPLARDLLRLAAIVSGEASAPFGPHTRIVVLADRVHEWTGGLAALLSLITNHGLGRNGHPVPVVVTGSRTLNAGPALESHILSNRGNPAVKSRNLGPLASDEATVGFQWVLLNPWDTQLPSYRNVYTAKQATASQAAAEKAFRRRLDNLPANARDELYDVAEELVQDGFFIPHDDITILADYAARNR